MSSDFEMRCRYFLELDRTINERDVWLFRQSIEEQKGYVYVAHMENTPYYKIGFSKNPKSRINEFQSTKLPNKIKLFTQIETDYMRELEQMMHYLYRQYRKNGEWYELPYECLYEICTIRYHESYMIKQAKEVLEFYEWYFFVRDLMTLPFNWREIPADWRKMQG